MTRARRGVTLLELCVVVVLLGVVGGAVAGVWLRGQRALARAALDVRAGATLRHAAAALAGELRSASTADALVTADSAVELFAPVGAGVACAVDARTIVVAADRGGDDAPLAQWSAAPRAGDVVHVHRGRRIAGAAPWAAATVAAASLVRGAAACPSPRGGPEPAGLAQWRLELDALPAGVAAGAWLRVGRRARWSLYRAGDGSWQLGRRDCPEPAVPCDAAQPVAGPLRPPAPDGTGGLHVVALDSSGLPAPAAADVALLGIALRARGPSRVETRRLLAPRNRP